MNKPDVENDSDQTKSTNDIELNKQENTYMAFVLVSIAFMVVSALGMHFLFVQDEEEIGVFHFTEALLWLGSAVAVSTSIVIYRKKTLTFVPMLLQNLALLIGFYTIPIAIMGFWLMLKNSRRLNDDQ